MTSAREERTTAPVLDLSVPTRIHLVGVGGTGMRSIARVLLALGHQVSGSDTHRSPGLDRLAELGVQVSVGHRPENVEGARAVVYSTAIPERNVELVTAQAAGAEVVHRSAVLAGLSRMKKTIAIAGTHGKTTTSSMCAAILAQAGLDPSFVVGGQINDVGSGAAWTGGEWFVVEADESDGTFLELDAAIAVVTSVEPDHLDHYGTFEAEREAFAGFLGAAGRSIAGSDEANVRALGTAAGSVLVGAAEGSEWQVSDLAVGDAWSRYRLGREGGPSGSFELPLPGVHFVRDAALAAVAAVSAGALLEDAVQALARFGGVERRFEWRGESGGVTYIDDYAHLPGEVAPTLATVAASGFHRVVAVFQPHRYSRTEALWRDFADSFAGADTLFVTDVYSAGEAPRPGVTGALVAEAVERAHPEMEVAFVANREDLVHRLRAVLQPGDCCITLGAGDLTTLADEMREGAR